MGINPSEERRDKNKCPRCGGNLENKDGRIECVSCDYGQVERRKERVSLTEPGVDGW